MKVRVFPSEAKGEILVPPSKSMAHRALMGAALSQGESLVSPIALSEDMLATMDCLRALGAEFIREGEGFRVRGISSPQNLGKTLCCRESGSTLRFLIPLCLLTGEKMTLLGSPRLMERPLGVYEAICSERGLLFEKEGETLAVKGPLSAGEFHVRADVSSQFITGLLYALPLLSGDSRIVLEGKRESESYLDMTLFALKEFGIEIKQEPWGYFISGGQRYRATDFVVEGDYSNAAFPCALALLSQKATLLGLREDSLQGDRVYRDIFPLLQEGSPTVDLSDCPDLAPILFVMAALFHGATFTGTKRLRLKESDRGEAMREELEKCGVRLTISENEIVVPKGEVVSPKESISSHNDHRIVMAMTVLLSRLGGEIEGAEAVKKSWPEFFDAMNRIGIEVIKEK